MAKTKNWREARRDAILAEARRAGCSLIEAAERLNARLWGSFGETTPGSRLITESASGGKKAAKRLREAAAAADQSPTVTELAAMNDEDWQAAAGAYWGRQIAATDRSYTPFSGYGDDPGAA